MHLLLAQKGTIGDGEEAIDLGQAPADVIFLSAADTELASLAGARAAMGAAAPELRLANLLRLRHPMSVDTYVERTVCKSSLIVVRLLGGETYWPYGLEALHAAAVNHGLKLAVLPGDDKPDRGLERFSTIPAEDSRALWQYLAGGGAENSTSFLEYCSALVGRGEKPGEAVPLLKAGLFAGPGGTGREIAGTGDKPCVAIVFYRALVQSGQTAPVTALCDALAAEGIEPLPVYVSSLKDPVSAATVHALFEKSRPDVVINLTGFAVSSPSGKREPTVLERDGAVVLQAVLSSSPEQAWRESSRGLPARDLAMNVALPEIDGRILSRAISFKSASAFDEAVQCDIVRHEPVDDRVRFVAKQAGGWSRLRGKDAADRRVAFILANYPNRDGRIANGVGLDTPAGTVTALRAMERAGYVTGGLPGNGDELVAFLTAGPTNRSVRDREIRETISLRDYKAFLGSLPEKIQLEVSTRWGEPENDPFFDAGREAFALPVARFGNVAIGIQPARGYNIDPKESYHSPDLVPPHNYFAFYAWLRRQFCADVAVHMGKHGNLEWLPGKALALSGECYPEAVFGDLPHVYPFIVNDPGEGTQAKRRSSAVIIDHLTPPLTRAESYGPLRELEGLVDEYYEAAGGDPRRLKLLRGRILDLVRDMGLDKDAGIGESEGEETALEKLDAYLCELKEMQIRDGLHVFGKAPEGRLLDDLVVALARIPREGGRGGDASLQRAIAADLWGGLEFDPLDCSMAGQWNGGRPRLLADLSPDPWRTNGDTVERIELLASALVSGAVQCPAGWTATKAVLDTVNGSLRPLIENCGIAEITGLLTALDGRFVAPGSSGAPTRGRPDVLPTGRNFFSVDCRAVPTEAAWELGRKSAEQLIARHVQDHGEWPESIALTAWGTSNMRTGGDDIAQAMALVGARPLWQSASRRVTGFEIIPAAKLGRPRVDVVLRISGFFRDAFPDQIALFDRAVRAIAQLDEDKSDNPIAARFRADAERLAAAGASREEAERRAGYRVFGSQPGAYGAGLQALMDEKGWADRSDLAEAWLVWGSYAYGAGEEGKAERAVLEERLRRVEAVVQNQDNREHDLLDSDDYYQFEGGMAATVEYLRGIRPAIYHNDHSRPEKPVIRTLEEEIGRVVRGRVVNPKWIEGVMRHGYKGAFEIAATVDYMFAFSATTGAVGDHHFEAAYRAFIADEKVRNFLAEKNPAALCEIADRFGEAIDRGLWTARSNSARFELRELARKPIQQGEASG